MQSELTLAESGATARPTGTMPALARGVEVGRYVVLGRLGAGGMGVVYAAYDPELDRKVAIKLLRPGEGSAASRSDARTRLFREAQALAKLAHPSVVAVHDVGTHGEQVWLAMEHVDGATLTAWCGKERRKWREVVSVLSAAGQGLAAAHAAGLLHRDFKPDNVMVSPDGRVRVMDFGLARAAGSQPIPAAPADTRARPRDDAIASELTAAGSVLGTPAYMAPEQHLGLPLDARTDQFSFCVTLWEALYGARPFGGETLAALAFAATQGNIRPVPRGRRVPAWLRRACLRGLCVEPEKRWPSMADLLSALERGRARGRLRAVALAGGLAVAIAGGAAGWERFAVEQRTRACEATAAEIESAWSEGTKTVVRAALLATGHSGATETADKAVASLDHIAQDWKRARIDSCLDAHVRETWTQSALDQSLWCLDERRMLLESLTAELSRADEDVTRRATAAAASFPRAAPCRDVAFLARQPDPPPPESRELLRTVREDISRARSLDSTGKYSEGLVVARRGLAQAEALEWPFLRVAARYRVGTLLERTGDFTGAEAMLEESYFEAMNTGLADGAADAAGHLVYVVGVRHARHAEGRRWARHAQAWLELLGGDTRVREANLLNNLAAIERIAGEFSTSRSLHERALALREAALGPNNIEVAYSLNNLAIVHFSTGDYAQAKALCERSLLLHEEVLGADHPQAVVCLNILGAVDQAEGDNEGAKARLERALAIRERAHGPDHPDVAAQLGNLGEIHEVMGDYAKARSLFERALVIQEKALGPEHPRVAGDLTRLGEVLVATGAHAEARPRFERALALYERASGNEPVDSGQCLLGLAQVELAEAHPSAALLLAQRALSMREQAGVAPEMIADARFVLAQGLWAVPGKERDRPRALALAHQALDVYREVPGKATALAQAQAWLKSVEAPEAGTTK